MGGASYGRLKGVAPSLVFFYYKESCHCLFLVSGYYLVQEAEYQKIIAVCDKKCMRADEIQGFLAAFCSLL